MTDAPGDPHVARTPDRAHTCPACGSSDLIPILYGLPGLDMVEAGRAGEIVIGGCLARDEAWRCRACRVDSGDQPRPSRFAVWDGDATDEEIAAWVIQASNDEEEETP